MVLIFNIYHINTTFFICFNSKTYSYLLTLLFYLFGSHF
nr:MAG TPA: hypothetical protein [Caudoviricetes sp.]